MNTPTFGSDPEVMLVDNERGRRIVSSIPVLRKDKFSPHLLSNGLKVYADNVLMEFSHPPFSSSEEGVERYRGYFREIKDFIGRRYSIHPLAAHHFNVNELGKSKKNEMGDEENPAWKAGCEDSFSPYIDGPNPKVSFMDEMRTGSFHIHVGHPELNTWDKKVHFVKLLDIFLGCSSVVFDKDNSNSMRRKYYGRAGEFRSTPYGVEYRVLGNFALRHPELTRLVLDIAAYCCTQLDNGRIDSIVNINGIQQKTQIAINLNYAPTAYKIIESSGLPSMLLKRVTDTYSIPTFDNAWGLN